MSEPEKSSLHKNPLFYGISTFLLVLIITQFIAYQNHQLYQKTEQQEIEQHVSKLKIDLQNILGQSYNATQTLAFIVNQYGTPDNFDSIAQLLLNNNTSIDALELVNEKGIITHVYPLKGNNVVGMNILNDPDNKFGAKITLEKKDYYTAGPLYLKQGGSGIIGRRPLYNKGKFNGFVAAVVRLSTVINTIKLDSPFDQKFSYQLVKINSDKTEETFYSSNNISKENATTLPLTTSQGEWKLYVYLHDNTIISSSVLFSVLGFLLSLVCGVLLWFLMRQPTKLKKIVDEKTALLKDSKERYKSLINGASDGIFLNDFRGNILDVNPYAISMFGFTKEELLNKNINELVPAEESSKNPPRFADIKSGKALRSERKLLKKDGSVFFGEVRAKMLDDNIIMGIIRDITERKELELSVEENLAKFSKAYNNKFVGMAIKDQNNKFVDANSYFLDLIGYSLEEIKGKSATELGLINLDKVNKDGNVDLLNSPHKIDRLQAEFITKKGSILHLLLSKEPYKYLDKNFSLSTYVDQTEAKRADREKQRLISIIENSPGFIGLATLSGEPLYLNDAGKKMINLPSDFNIYESKIFDFFDDKYKSVIVNEHMPTVMKKGLWTGEVPLKNFKTDTITPLEFYGFLIKDETTDEPIAIGSIGFDLTERKKNQKEILELQSKMNAAIRIGKIGYWDFDISTQSFVCSPLMYSIYDIEPDQLLTIPLLESLIHPDDVEKHRKNVREIILEKSSHAFSYRIIVKDGSIKYVMVDIEVLRDSEDKAINFRGTVIDITKQKEADFEILDLQSKMNAAIRIGNIGYWNWDMSDDNIEWSKEMYAIHDVEPGTKITPDLIKEIIYHKDLGILDRKLAEKKGQGISAPSNYRIKLKDNSLRYLLSFSEIIYDDNDKPIIYRGTTMDVTKNIQSELALKESQEKFSKAFQTNLMGMLILDGKRRVIEANEMAYTILETSKKKLIGKTVMDSKEVKIDEIERDRLWGKLQEDGEILNEEYKIELKSGVKKTLIMSIAQLQLKDKINYLVNIYDDSKRKEAENRLETQFHELQKTNSELDSFVYSASHELRAPLSSVLGLIQLIQMEDINPKLFQHLNMMEKSIERLDDFIKDIIEYSRNKHLALNLETIDFTTLIEHSIESLWYLENTHKINININVEDNIDFASDSKRISVLLNNFISNAIKYHDTNKKDPTIWILVKTTNQEAILVIKDNGLGMANSQLDKIFDMFYRVSSKVMGSGIGLFIAKEVLFKLKGTVDVQSKIGEGTTFTLKIPNEIS